MPPISAAQQKSPAPLPIGPIEAAYWSHQGCLLVLPMLPTMNPPPQQPTKHHGHCSYPWSEQRSLSPLPYTATILCCRGRITLHTRAGVDPDQLNFSLDDYTDEEIPDSIAALQDAIKLDQVGAKLLSAFATVWLTAHFPGTISQQVPLQTGCMKDAALLSLHLLTPNPTTLQCVRYFVLWVGSGSYVCVKP